MTTPASIALNDLVATMAAIDRLYDVRTKQHRELTDDEDRRLSALDNRRAALEDQLEKIVRAELGVDYFTLWHAVTPTSRKGPRP